MGFIVACSSCGRNKKENGYYQPKLLDTPPYNSSDVIIDGEKANINNWRPAVNKLLLFYSLESEYPETENVNSICNYAEEINGLNTDIYIATIQNNTYEIGCDVKKLYSYILPVRLNLVYNGVIKNANVFVAKTGEIIIQEIFPYSTRNFGELVNIIREYERA